MKQLDRQHSIKVAGKSSMPCKITVEGTLADSLTLKDAPELAVDPNWSKFTLYLACIVLTSTFCVGNS